MNVFSKINIVIWLLVAFATQTLAVEICYNVFENGKEGYNCYRIPAVIEAPNGDLLAFAEARKNDCDDFGDVDIVMKRSLDKGKTWGNLELLVDNGNFKAGEPAPVVDYTDPQYPLGRLFFLYNTGKGSEEDMRQGNAVREIFYMTSVDNGATWSKAVNITSSVHKPFAPEVDSKYSFRDDWRNYANTPGHAFQIKKGKFKGRIVVPAYHSIGPRLGDLFANYFAHCYYSDNHGTTWQLGATVEIPGGNESIGAELSDGGIIMNSRYQHKGMKKRIISMSTSGGEKWDTSYIEEQLPEPICQGSMIDINYNGFHALLFCNPTSVERREKLGVRVSLDDGKKWSDPFIVEPGDAAYSDLVYLGDGLVGVLYEKGNRGGIVFKVLNVENVINLMKKDYGS